MDATGSTDAETTDTEATDAETTDTEATDAETTDTEVSLGETDGGTAGDTAVSPEAVSRDSSLSRSVVTHGIRYVLPVRVRQSYSLKLLVALLVIVALVGASGVYVQSQLSTTLRSDINDRLLVQTQSESEELEEFVATHRVPTRLLSNHPVYATADEERLRSFFAEKRRGLPSSVVHFHVISVGTKRIFVSSSPAFSSGDRFSEEWIDTTSFTGFGDVFVTDPYTNQQGTAVIGFLSPIRESPTRVLVVTVDVSEMEKNFESTTSDGFTQVVTGDGTVIFAANESEQLEPYLDGDRRATAVRRGRAGDSGFLRDSAKEQELSGEYIQAYASVDGTDWVLIKHAPTDQAYRLEAAVTRGILLLVAITLLGVVTIGGALGRDTADAVSTLAEKVETIEAGEYDVDLSRRRHDEIGELFAAVSRMRDRLVERVEQAETAQARAQTASEKLQRRNEEIQEQKAMISVLNRFLRHNLRNRLNVMLGHLELLDPDTPPELRQQRRDRLRETVDDLLDKAEKARSVESLASGETETRTVDVSALLEEEVERCRDEYPEARITEEIDPVLTANAHGTLRVVFENLVENAVLHNNNPVPEVRVSASLVDGTGPQRTSTDEQRTSTDEQRTPTDEQRDATGERRDSTDEQRDDSDLTGCAGSEQREAEVVVRIADDGPGIPQPEIDALEEEYETALTHASGIGLWITNWIVSEFDGELTFDRREPTGTVVTIRLPAA